MAQRRYANPDTGPDDLEVYIAAEGGTTFVLKADIVTGANVTIFNANAPFAFRVIDAWSVCTADSSESTWKVTDGSNDIISNVTVALNGNTDIDRAADIDDSKDSIPVGGSLVVEATVISVIVYIECVRE